MVTVIATVSSKIYQTSLIRLVYIRVLFIAHDTSTVQHFSCRLPAPINGYIIQNSTTNTCRICTGYQSTATTTEYPFLQRRPVLKIRAIRIDICHNTTTDISSRTRSMAGNQATISCINHLTSITVSLSIIIARFFK